MSDDDSGVDSDSEPNNLSPALESHDEHVLNVIAIGDDAANEEQNNQDLIEVDPPEINDSSSNNSPCNSNSANASDDNNNVLNIDNPVMLCQDNYDNWPNSGDAPASATTTTVESSFNEYNQSEEMQFSASTEQVDTHIPSTSDSSVKVLGFKLRIDEDTMSNLHSFYQNNIGQHDFSPKMTKNRKRRVSHYEHLIAEKQLRTAANMNDYKGVCRLLNLGVNVNAFDDRKRTALHFAACHGNFGIAYALLDHGANPNQKDIIGNTPLHLAVCSSKLDIVILLLKNGANCNASDNTGRTPLQLAKSKLSIMSQSLANSKTLPTVNLKLESMKISIMLGIYFEKVKNEKKPEIDVFKTRLETRETNEEIEQDVNDLLKCLNEWTI